MNPDDWDLLARILRAQLHQNPEPRVLPDGRALHLALQMYNSKLTVSPSVNSQTWTEAYWFEDETKARVAFEAWDGTGDPEGWIRHVPSWRRRPGGDKSKEYVKQ